MMFEIHSHNESDCIKLLNMIICEIPFLKSFTDDCLTERLLNLISIISNAFDDNQSFHSTALDTEEEREDTIREWLSRHYTCQCLIEDLDFKVAEDRARVAVLIISILFKLRHSLKDVEQYLKDCDSFIQFDRQLNHITRFDRLLEMVENDSNKWKSKARECEVRLEEFKRLIDKYHKNEIFNYNCNPRNQNLYKSRISTPKDDDSVVDSVADEDCFVVEPSEHMTNGENQSFNGNKPCDGQSVDSQGNPTLISGFESQNIKTVENRSHLCVDCDQYFASNFEFNLHFLKVHRNVDISHIIRDSNAANGVTNDVPNGSDLSKKSTLSRPQKKRSFKCLFYKCGKSFHKSYELKNHFLKHQPNVSKVIVVYNDYTNASLNAMRATVPKARRVSNDSAMKSNNRIEFNNSLIRNTNQFSFNSRMNCNEVDISCEPDLIPVPLFMTTVGNNGYSKESLNYFSERIDENFDFNEIDAKNRFYSGLRLKNCENLPKVNGLGGLGGLGGLSDDSYA